MAETKEELIRWLSTLPDGVSVGVDDGGLVLRVVDDEDNYIEIGGLPLDDDSDDIDIGAHQESCLHVAHGLIHQELNLLRINNPTAYARIANRPFRPEEHGLDSATTLLAELQELNNKECPCCFATDWREESGACCWCGATLDEQRKAKQ